MFKILNRRYNAITWFPKSLMIQFLRAANIYFLIVTILTAMPFSPKVKPIILFILLLKKNKNNNRLQNHKF